MIHRGRTRTTCTDKNSHGRNFTDTGVGLQLQARRTYTFISEHARPHSTKWATPFPGCLDEHNPQDNKLQTTMVTLLYVAIKYRILHVTRVQNNRHVWGHARSTYDHG